MKSILASACLAVLTTCCANAQDLAGKTVLACDEQNTCSHRYENGELLKTITSPSGVSVTVALEESKNGKYFRVRLGVANNSQKTFDLMPEAFLLNVVGGKTKTEKPIPPEDMERAAERAAFWANYLTAVTAHMARDTVRTNSSINTQSSGTIRGTGVNNIGDSASYIGNSTSTVTTTSSIPDYNARAEASQRIRERNELVAAQNAVIAQTALRDNTLAPTQAVGGFVYFKSATADELHARIIVDGIEYNFEF